MGYSLLNESGDLLTYPDNSLIGIIDRYSDVRAALKDLRDAGFDEDETGVLCGADGAKEIDADGSEHGVLGKVAQVVREFGDVDNAHKETHEKALREGHFLIAVHAKEEEERKRALNILNLNNAHFINFYSPWVIEGLEP
jgi:hypothetical protein